MDKIIGSKNFHMGLFIGGQAVIGGRVEPHFFWFRLFGYGLHFRWLTGPYKPLYSERSSKGVCKAGKLWIKLLRRN